MKTVYLNMVRTKTALFCALFFLCSLATFAEAPTRGINYQAIARDDNGNPLTNKYITVQLSILQGTYNGTLVWQERHYANTNNFGLFTLVIGQGATTGAGSLPSMNNIEWTSDNYFVQVSVDFGSGLTDMGTTQLQAVPYAMRADSALAGPKYPMASLPDVNVSGLTTNQGLTWNGTQWVPTAVVTASQLADDSAALADLFTANLMILVKAEGKLNKKVDADSTAIANMINNTNTSLNNFENLPNGQMYMGNTNNIAAPVTLTGDATLTNTGVMTIGDNAITTSKITDGGVTNTKLGTGIDAAKIADGSISNTDFENLGSTKGNIQTQITVNAANIAANTTAITTLQSEVNTNTTDITNTNNSVQSLNEATANLISQVNNNTSSINQLQGNITDLQTTTTTLQEEGQVLYNQTLTNTTQIQQLESLPSGQMLVGNSGNVSTPVSMSGDATMSNTGVVTIGGLDATKLADGSVNNATFEYLGGATSNIQNQLNAHSTEIATLNNNVEALEAGTATLEDFFSVQSQVNTIDNTLTTDSTNISNLQNQVTGIGVAMSADETNITALQNQVNTNTTNIATINNSLATLRTTTTTLETQMIYGETQLNQLESLKSGQMFVGNSSNQTAPVTMSGDVTMDSTGTTTIGVGTVTVSKIAATGTTDNTTFLRGDGTWAAPTAAPATTFNGTTVVASQNINTPSLTSGSPFSSINIVQNIEAFGDVNLMAQAQTGVIVVVNNPTPSTIQVAVSLMSNLPLPAWTTGVYLKTSTTSFTQILSYEMP